MGFFRKRIKLISTDYGWVNEKMFIFLRDNNINRIIHLVGRPNFGLDGEILYQYNKYI